MGGGTGFFDLGFWGKERSERGLTLTGKPVHYQRGQLLDLLLEGKGGKSRCDTGGRKMPAHFLHRGRILLIKTFQRGRGRMTRGA